MGLATRTHQRALRVRVIDEAGVVEDAAKEIGVLHDDQRPCWRQSTG